MSLVKKPRCEVWVYQCQVNGKTWNRSTGEIHKKKAEAKVPELRRLAELHRRLPEGSLTLEAAIVKELDWIESTVSESEAIRADYGLNNFAKWAGNVPLEKITTPLLAEYQKHRVKKAAINTIKREVCGIIRLLKRNGFVVQKPDPIRGRKTTNRAFTPDELERFFAVCCPAHRILFLTMLTTGARPAELVPSKRSNHVALLKTEVDSENDTITLRNAKLKIGQEEKIRLVKIPQELMEELVEYARTTSGPHVFPSRNSSLKNVFDRILKRAEIPKINVLGHKLTAHSFRHTYATMMAEALGNNPFILKQALGHSQITTTDRYCHNQAPAVVIDITPYTGRVKRSCKEEAPESSEAL